MSERERNLATSIRDAANGVNGLNDEIDELRAQQEQLVRAATNAADLLETLYCNADEDCVEKSARDDLVAAVTSAAKPGRSVLQDLVRAVTKYLAAADAILTAALAGRLPLETSRTFYNEAQAELRTSLLVAKTRG